MAAHQEPLQRAAAIQAFVSNHMKWDGRSRYLPEQNIKKTYDERVGSSADINALLVSMLRAADIQADPVILSTRDHGMVHPVYPILDKFNYLAAVANIDGNVLLLDATEKNLPAGVLPTRCINHKGRVISENYSDWVSLEPTRSSQRFIMCNMNMNDGGEVHADVVHKLSGYHAIAASKALKEIGEDKYLDQLRSSHDTWQINKLEVQAPDVLSEPLIEKLDVSVKGCMETVGNIMYINPIVEEKIAENPFRDELRKLPVDFNYPYSTYYMANISLPEGFTLDELPQSASFSTISGDATYKYLVQNHGKMIQLISQLDIKKGFFSTEEYAELREFFAMVVAKQNEQVVLKKL
jgi:hypothetical protein